MIQIDNTQGCFVELWRKLEHTRRLHLLQRKRYCIRNILKTWLGTRATDDLIFEVCMRSRLEGYNEMPPPMLSPRDPREFLRAVVSVVMDIGMRSVRYHALDRAYSIAFPDATPINVNKKRSKGGEFRV